MLSLKIDSLQYFEILNLINGIYETQNKTIYKFEFNYCEEQLDTKLCWEEYKNQ